MYVYMLAHSGPYLKGGGDQASEEASLYNLANHTITNMTRCPEMGGLDSQRGATLDAQKTLALTLMVWLGAFAISLNSGVLVRHLLHSNNLNIYSNFKAIE